MAHGSRWFMVESRWFMVDRWVYKVGLQSILWIVGPYEGWAWDSIPD